MAIEYYYLSPNATGQDIQTILAASLTPAALVAIVGVGTVAILLVKHLWRYNNFLHDIMCLHVMSSSLQEV